MKKIISVTLSVIILMMTSLPTLATTNIPLNEINVSLKSKDDGTIYKESFIDEEGKETLVKAQIDEKQLVVKTFIDGKLIDSTRRKILSNGSFDNQMEYSKYENLDVSKTSSENIIKTNTQILDVNNFIEKSTSNDSIKSSRSASYPYIKSKYNSGWGYTGSLYGEQVDTEENKTRFNFGENTAVSVIVSTLVGAGILLGTGGLTVASLVEAFGGSVISGFITTYIFGYVKQEIEEWEYEVYVLGEYVLYGEINYIYAETYNNDNYLTGEFEDIETGGPYDNEDELIDYGVYNYVISQ